MSRLKSAVALSLLTAAALVSGCSEDFATGPEKFPGNLDVLSWADTLVIGQRQTVTARVLDAQGREVLDRSIQWTIGSPSVLGIALAASGSSALDGVATASTLSVAGGVPVQLRTVAAGTSVVSLEFADALFHETTAERTVAVVTAGVQLATASDTTLGAIGDTAIVVAFALGRSTTGDDQPVAGLGVTWTRQGPGAVALIGEGDTVRVVAMQVGTDTLVVRHAACLAGAQCADTLRVQVQEEGSEPPLATLTLSPASAEKAVNQTQQFEVTTGGAGPYLWSVVGVDGGNGTAGTVSVGGLYAAPGAVPAGGPVEVCARVQATPAVTGCATVTVSAAPPSGADVIVINDIDMWSYDYGNTPGNLAFFANIVNYSGTGSRLAGKSVMYYTGSNSLCASVCGSTGGYTELLSSTFVSLGYTLIDESNTLTNIPADVKVIFIWLPLETIGTAEVNALKQFASEGGRLVVVGENGGWYGSGIPVENQLLADLGSQLVNLGGCAWGGGVVESDHQLVAGVNELSIACASGMTPGPNDFVVVREPGTGVVLVAVTRIDLTPLEIE